MIQEGGWTSPEGCKIAMIELDCENEKKILRAAKLRGPEYVRDISINFTQRIQNSCGITEQAQNLAFRAVLRETHGSTYIQEAKVHVTLTDTLKNIQKFGVEVDLDKFPEYPQYGLSFKPTTISLNYAIPNNINQTTVVIVHDNSDMYYNNHYFLNTNPQNYQTRLQAIIIINWT